MAAEPARATATPLADILDRVVERAAAEEPASFVALTKAAGLDPATDFVGASLRNMDLRGEDLRGFDFSRADLGRADLRGANLTGVPLDNADLYGAKVEGAIGLVAQPATRPTRLDFSPEISRLNGLVYCPNSILDQQVLRSVLRLLPRAVNKKLRGTQFTLWDNFQKFSRNSAEENAGFDVFIMLLSPAWLRSSINVETYLYNTKYLQFSDKRVIPIKIAQIGDHAREWTAEQGRMWDELFQNGNSICLPLEFDETNVFQRRKIMGKIASQIAHIIEPNQNQAFNWVPSAGQIFSQGKPKTGKPGSKRVLIVDSDELSRSILGTILRRRGYSTLGTADGVQALRLARKWRPDLILMEIWLPEVSGLEVTRWIKSDDDLRTIPVIAVTQFALKGDDDKIRDGGCEGYIEKPISIPAFLRTVERFLA